MAIDVGKELRRAVDTGKVFFGRRQVEKEVLKGECKLVIISQKAEKYARERLEQVCKASKIPFYEFEASGLEIGRYCGKPFVVSFAAVKDAGKSKILQIVKGSK
jgi:large subunit ribosomal protein L30e